MILQLTRNYYSPLGVIFEELITNTMKYAFPDNKKGLLKISFKKFNNHAILTLHDNGIGLPKNFDINQSKRFGLMIVKMLSQQLHADFKIENDSGIRCSLKFNI